MEVVLIITLLGLFIVLAYIQERINECPRSKHLFNFHSYVIITRTSDPGKYWRELRRNLGLSGFVERRYKICKYCLKEEKIEEWN